MPSRRVGDAALAGSGEIEDLTRAARAVEQALEELERAMGERGDAVRAALDAGLDPAEIAGVSDLTVGQVWNAGRGDPISPPPLARGDRRSG